MRCLSSIGSMAMLILLATPPALTSENATLRFSAHLAPRTGTQSILKETRAFCREAGWRESSLHGPGLTRIRIRTGRNAPWLEIRVLDSGVVEGEFNTLETTPLVHVRLISILDRLESCLTDLHVKDTTRFYWTRNHGALRRYFSESQALVQKVVEEAFRRGEEVTAGGKLHTQIPLPAREAFQVALDRLVEGQLEAAHQALDQAIGLYPAHARALVLRAEILVSRGETEKALSDANRAIRTKPEMAAGYYARAKALLRRENIAGAIQDLDTAIHHEPGHAECRILRGLLYLNEKNNPAQAVTDLERVALALLNSRTLATDRYPGGMHRQNARMALTGLARCYESLKKYREEREVLNVLEILTTAEEPVTGAAAAVFLDQDQQFLFTIPPGWRIEQGKEGPHNLLRLYDPRKGDACRIALMKQWGKITNPDFRTTFNSSVMKGLTLVGNEPKMLQSFTHRVAGFPVYQILVKISSDSSTHCWVACMHHAKKMVTVYLSSYRSPAASRAVLKAMLERIERKIQ